MKKEIKTIKNIVEDIILSLSIQGQNVEISMSLTIIEYNQYNTI